MEERYLSSRDGHRLFLRVWRAGKARATLHINHGMAEHSLRYEPFALYMNSLGFDVYAQDHRGHGLTKEEDERGWFADSNGWDLVVQDSIHVDNVASNESGGLPHYVLGHSMGSFVTRIAISRVPDLFSGAVIMGTGAGQGIVGSVGKMMARRHAKKLGTRMPDRQLDKLSFGSYNKKFEPKRTDFDWLSRDVAEVDKYIADPLCGFVCSTQFYVDLITLVEQANSKDNARKISQVLPLLVVSGADDPVGGFGKGVEKVYRMYRDCGIYEVGLKLFEGARHKILNETNKDEVWSFVGSWLSSHADRFGD